MGTGKSQALGPRVKWQLKNSEKIIKTLQNISKFHLKFFYKILKSRKLTQICHPTKCKIHTGTYEKGCLCLYNKL